MCERTQDEEEPLYDTRECLALEADTSLGSGRVTRVLAFVFPLNCSWLHPLAKLRWPIEFPVPLWPRHECECNEFTLFSLSILPILRLKVASAMGYMKRAEARYTKEHASIRPVMMQFAYDSTVRLWRVTFRPRGVPFLCRA